MRAQHGSDAMSKPIWTPTPERIANANLSRFIALVNERLQRGIGDYESLHAFSIEEPQHFWLLLAEFCGVQFDRRAETALQHGATMRDARWFPGARLNIARTLLAAPDAASAIVALR